MQYRYKINGETPAKKNSKQIFNRNGKTIVLPSKNYQEWHDAAMIQLSMHKEKPADPINVPVSVNLFFVHGDLRRRDSDNGCSSIMDLLVDAGILEDDNWEIVSNIVIDNAYDKGNSHVIIEINTI